jgi:hypothetical protein
MSLARKSYYTNFLACYGTITIQTTLKFRCIAVELIRATRKMLNIRFEMSHERNTNPGGERKLNK